MTKIDAVLPFELDIPNPYPDMAGLKTQYGTATMRVFHALYVAKRISDYAPGKVMEIGAGLGWLAYYARKFGVGNYTIVDIPMTAVASSHFLSAALGEDAVSVLGEERDAPVRILTPSQFPEDEKYDLIVNVDSLTEMDIDVAEDYWDKIKKCTKRFLSVNHENNSFTTRELAEGDRDVVSYAHFPCWIRNGYVEEIFEFK